MQVTLRIFRCQNCNHLMRMSGNKCGRCWTDKRFYQKPAVHVWVLVAVFAILAIVVYLQFMDQGPYRNDGIECPDAHMPEGLINGTPDQ